MTGFEPFLAGCGAYERVTPQFKAGARIVPVGISGDGSRVVGSSIAVLAGAEGYGEFAKTMYESDRTGTGWVTSALSPPSRLYPAQEYLDSNPSLGRSLWAVRTPLQAVAAEDLLLRERNGELVKVGPMMPSSATEGPAGGEVQVFGNFSEVLYSGASSDLSHVFFQITADGPLWPGDTTLPNSGQRSLYEYAGTANTHPFLVGVDDANRVISGCGTSLGADVPPGGHNADTYNAISEDGRTVYFTAVRAGECAGGAGRAPEVDEVYARVGLGAAAYTVAISEPTSTDCDTCQTITRTDAEFQGASRSGQQVFFISNQEMFKGDAGANLYEYDFANPEGQKLLRVSSGEAEPKVLGVARVSEDGSHVYFVAEGALTTANAEHRSPTPGAPNLYVFERDAAHPAGHLVFIATLSEADYRDWRAEDTRPVQVTPDGRFVVFQSAATTGSVPQVFEYDANREELARISVGERGYPVGEQSADEHGATVEPQFGAYNHNSKVDSQTARLTVSNNGSVVVFQSNGALTQAATTAGAAGLSSIYEYRSSGDVSNGEVSSISDGDGLFVPTLAGMEPAGQNIFFFTQDPVLPSDLDTQEDTYDAHIEGGFAVPPEVRSCLKTVTCQRPEGVASPVEPLASTLTPGGGNLPAVTGQPPGVRVLLPAQRLSAALQACRKAHRPGHKRRACEATARKRLRTIKSKGKK